MKFFDLDGPFQRFGSMAFDILVVNALWFILTFFSLGILSGPALTGSYASLYACVVSDEGYMLKQFFRRFKKRFFVSLLLGIINLLLLSLSLFNIYSILTGIFGSIWLLPVYTFMLIEVGFIFTFIFPLLAHTDFKFTKLLKTAFFLAHKHLPTSIITSVLNGALFVLVIFVLLGDFSLLLYLFIAGGIIFSINSYLISKLILNQYEFFKGAA